MKQERLPKTGLLYKSTQEARLGGAERTGDTPASWGAAGAGAWLLARSLYPRPRLDEERQLPPQPTARWGAEDGRRLEPSVGRVASRSVPAMTGWLGPGRRTRGRERGRSCAFVFSGRVLPDAAPPAAGPARTPGLELGERTQGLALRAYPGSEAANGVPGPAGQSPAASRDPARSRATRTPVLGHFIFLET